MPPIEVILFIWVAFAVVTAFAAPSRGREFGTWFVLGLLFGVFALIAVLVLPPRTPGLDRPTPKTHVECPDCAEYVRNEARVCKHCGCKLIPQTK